MMLFALFLVGVVLVAVALRHRCRRAARHVQSSGAVGLLLKFTRSE